MRIDVLTLFPGMFTGPMTESIIKRARESRLIEVQVTNIRDFATDKHRITDDYPFGGGAGMVMKPEPIFSAVDAIEKQGKPRIILMCPQGQPFSQKIAQELAQERHLIFICGHYEGIDERVRQELVTDELSIGDYILTGGELPAMVVIDSVARLIPGVLGEAESHEQDSFSDGLLEYPQYTRPREYRGMVVPDVLLSGDHNKIGLWRRQQSIKRTLAKRPDLLTEEQLSPEDRKLMRMKIEVDSRQVKS